MLYWTLLRCAAVISKESFSSDERQVVLLLAALYSFRMLGLFMVLPLLGLYAIDLPGATPETIGFALGAYGLTQAALQIPLGWLSDRIGRRPVILGGLCVFIIGSFVAAGAESINGIILGRFLQGCGAIAAALSALVADYTRDSQRTKSMAIIGASIGLSFVVALILGPLIAASGGLQGVFWVTACLGGCGVLLVLFALPSRPNIREAVIGDWEVSHVFDGGLPVLYLSIFLLHGSMMVAFLVIPKLLVDSLGFSADHHWLLYLGALILSIVPALMIMRRSRGDSDLRVTFSLAIVSLLAGVLLALNADDFWLLAGGLVLFFIGVNSLEALLPSTVSRLAPSLLRGTAMGVYSTAQFLGIFVGGSVGGLILGARGVHGVSLLVVALGVVWLLLLAFQRIQPSIVANSNE